MSQVTESSAPSPQSRAQIINLFGGETVASLGEHLIQDHAQIAAVAMVVVYKNQMIDTMFSEVSNSDLALMAKVFDNHINHELFGE